MIAICCSLLHELGDFLVELRKKMDVVSWLLMGQGPGVSIIKVCKNPGVAKAPPGGVTTKD